MAGESNRRQFKRVTLKTSVNLQSNTNFYSGLANDISEGGIFVATYNLLPADTEIDIIFSLPDQGEPIRTLVRVMWFREHLPDSDGHPGMGLEFVNLAEEDRRRIVAFVGIRATILYE